MAPLRVAGALAILAAGFFAWYELVESPVAGAFAPVVTRANAPCVALTFDDGPTPGITDRLLDVLAREQIPATFFVVGRAARGDPALLRRMAAGGHEIENHSDTHPHLNAFVSAAPIDAEIERTDRAVLAATGRRTHWLRPPFGARNAAVLDAARRHGMQVVLWTAMLDQTSPGAPPDDLVERLLPGRAAGGIIVLHDGDQGRGAGGRSYEAGLAPRVIERLRKRGYRFVTLDRLMHGCAGRD